MGMSTGDRDNDTRTPPNILPKFGMTGTVLPGTWSDVQPPWQKLPELPKLNIPKGEAWDRNMILTVWVKEVILSATTASMKFSKFV